LNRFSARLGGLGVGLLVALASAVNAAPAAARVTSSTISTPTGGFFQANFDSPDPQTIHVAGTVQTDDANASDSVNIICVASGSSYVTLGSASVQPDGSFSADVTYAGRYPFYAATCTLRAVEPSSGGAAWSNFAGPVIGYGYVQTYKVGGSGPNAATTYDWDILTSQPGGGADYESAGDCGIDYSWLYRNGMVGAYYGDYYRGPWDCNGYFSPADGGLYSGSMVTVDGHNAYLPYAANNINNAGANMPQATLDQRVDPSTGVMTATETDQLAYCTNADDSINDRYDPRYNGVGCDHWTLAPVALTRSYTENHSGRQITQADQWQSTDGASHPVRLQYEEDFNYCYIQLPGQSAASNCDTTAGQEATVPATAPATIYAYNYPDEPINDNQSGGLTYMDRPDRIVFNNQYSLVRVYNRTVPASGALNETTVYSSGMSQGQAAALAQAAQGASSAPSLAITSPAPNAILGTSVANVTGTASDDQPLTSIKVNGITTSVNSDGTWSQQIPLNPGPNTITAVATDSGGNATTVSETVVYAPSAATCTVPNVAGQTLAHALSSLTLAGCTVGKTTSAPSNKVKKGSIISSSAKAGSKVSAFVPVDLVVSSGKLHKASLVTRTVRLHGKRLTIKVRCPQGSVCNGTAKIRTTTSLAGHHRTLGTHAFQAPGGKKRSVTFTLSSVDAARVHAKGTVKALVFIVSRGAAGTSRTGRYHLTIKG
jgi:Glucodextranase, domain B/PASTA domain